MAVVTIVVPVYNTMQWLADCVESIRGQTLQDIEIILVDDGSTDLSGAICDAYAELDGRINVLHQENRGVSAARNAGMDLAAGKYIMFCDSDDHVDPDWCRCAVQLAEKNPDALVVLSVKQQIGNDNTREITYSETEEYSILKYGEYSKIFKTMIGRVVWNKIFRKDLIMRYKMQFDESVPRGEDFLFVVLYLDVADRMIVKNGSPLYCYRSWSKETLCTRYLGFRYFYLYARQAECIKRLITKEERLEYFRWFFWSRGVESLAQIMDSRSPDTLEKRIQDCRKIISTREFKEWCGAAAAVDPDNSLLRLLMEGDFQKAYEPLVQYMEETGRLL